MINARAAVILLVFFFGLYFFLSPKKIYGSNDGAHFVLLRNLDIGQTKLDERLMPYTGNVSFAEFKGIKYSDRPPGLAVLSAPLYFSAKVLSRLFPFEFLPLEMESSISGLQSNTEDFFPASSFGVAIVHMVPIFFSAATISILFLFLSLYTSRIWLCFLLSGLFGIGTLFAKYATVFFSHNVSGFFTMAIVFLLFRIKNSVNPLGLRVYACFGFCLGYTSLLEYQMAILGLGVLIVIAFGYKSFFRISSGLVNDAVLRFLFWGAVPVLAMACYQYALFGDLTSTTYSHHGTFLYAHSFAGMFSGNITDGLLGLLITPSRHGLFSSSPFILVGVIAALVTLTRNQMEKTFLLFVALAHIVCIAHFKEWHGGGFYPRYIIWSALLLYIAGALWLVEAWEICVRRESARFYRVESFLLLVFTFCAAYGVYNNIFDFPLFFSATKVYDPSIQNSYFPGFTHWPLFGLVMLFPFYLWIFRGFYSEYLWKSNYKIFLVVAFFVLTGVFLLNKSADIPSWAKRKILVLENFHVWNVNQENRINLETAAEVLPQRYSVNLQGTGGNFLYPVAYDQPGNLVYRLPRLAPGSRLFLSLDFTVTGLGNQLAVTGIMPNGITWPIFAIESANREVRYFYSKELTGFDLTQDGNLINISLKVKSGSTTLFDSRLEFLEIYTY